MCQEWDPMLCSHFIFSGLASRLHYLVLPTSRTHLFRRCCFTWRRFSKWFSSYISRSPRPILLFLTFHEIDRVSLIFHKAGLCFLWSAKRFLILYALRGGHILFMFRKADPLYFTYFLEGASSLPKELIISYRGSRLHSSRRSSDIFSEVIIPSSKFPLPSRSWFPPRGAFVFNPDSLLKTPSRSWFPPRSTFPVKTYSLLEAPLSPRNQFSPQDTFSLKVPFPSSKCPSPRGHDPFIEADPHLIHSALVTYPLAFFY